MFPEPVADPVKPDGMEPRVTEDYLRDASSRWVPVKNGFYIFFQARKHGAPLVHSISHKLGIYFPIAYLTISVNYLIITLFNHSGNECLDIAAYLNYGNNPVSFVFREDFFAGEDTALCTILQG
jgi:hypothetical protein